MDILVIETNFLFLQLIKISDSVPQKFTINNHSVIYNYQNNMALYNDLKFILSSILG